MKDLFDRNAPKMTPDEDRRVWRALSGALETRRPWWQRRGVLGGAAVAATAVVALAVWTPRLEEGPAGVLAERVDIPAVPAETGLADETVADTRGRRDEGSGSAASATGETAASAEPGETSGNRDKKEDGGREAELSPTPAGITTGTVDDVSTPVARSQKDAPAAKPNGLRQELDSDGNGGPAGRELRAEEAPANQVDRFAMRTAPEGTLVPPVTPAPAPSPTPPISVGGTDPVNDEPYDAMFFRNYGVNPFVDPAEDRFATFAVDVDDASYALARSYLQGGNLPPKEAVRVEEFVNAFDHGYAAPTGDLLVDRDAIPSEHGTFAIHLAGGPSPFSSERTLFRVGLKGRTVDPELRKPAMLTFVVDVSGSMNREDRLGLVKQSLGVLVDELRSDDWIALVVYGSDARTVLAPTPVSDRGRIERAIASLAPEGATNAEAGLLEAYRLADKHLTEGWINRVILCSDGVANVGNTGPDSILERIKQEARRGITLTTVGFGMGNYNDVLMERLANDGDGNYHYVDSIREAEKIFVDDLTANLQIIAREVKIQVEFDDAHVRRYRLVGYENRDVADVDFRNDRVDAGEVGAGHEVTALFELVLTEDARPDDEFAITRIRYEDPETGRVTEEARGFRVKDVARSWKDAEATLRMDAAVASFAELLRGSYWARDIDLGVPRQLADRAYRDLGRPEELGELLGLIDTADRLWPTDAPTPWKDDPRFGEDEPR